MSEREGGQWNVVATKAGVQLERVSDDGESLFDDVLEPDEARQLGELLTKHAAKVGESEKSDDNDEDGDESDDEGGSDDEDTDDESKASGDEQSDEDESDDDDKKSEDSD